MSATDPDRWTVVMPVKSPDRGKSRIAMAPADRAQLAAALAFDTVAAVAGSAVVGAVVVVTDGASALSWTDELPTGRHKVRVLPSHSTDLNGAIRDGVAACAVGPIAVLPGDVPGLSPDQLDEVLTGLTAPLSVVADADGVGTTLLAARDGARPDPRYGPSSFERHRAAGAESVVLPSTHWLRRDVDTLQDVRSVVAAFPHSRTAQVMSGIERRDGLRCGDGPRVRC